MKKIVLSTIKNLTHVSANDFSDDGTRFSGYVYHPEDMLNNLSVTYTGDAENVYVSIRFPEDIPYQFYREVKPEIVVLADEFNGVSRNAFDKAKFERNLEDVYSYVCSVLRPAWEEEKARVFSSENVKKVRDYLYAEGEVAIARARESQKNFKVFESDIPESTICRLRGYFKSMLKFQKDNLTRELTYGTMLRCLPLWTNWKENNVLTFPDYDFYLKEIENAFDNN